MKRRATDARLYQDFRDLACVVMFVDQMASLILVVLWHL